MLKCSIRLIVLCCLLMIAGCATSRVEGNATIYTVDLNSILLNIAAVIAAFVYAIFQFTKKKILNGILGITGGVFGCVILFGMVGDKLTVTPDEFELVRRGIGSENSAHLRYDDLNQATITLEITSGRRGRKNKNYYLNCGLKSGETKVVPIGTLMKAGLDEILGHMQAHHVPVHDQTGE